MTGEPQPVWLHNRPVPRFATGYGASKHDKESGRDSLSQQQLHESGGHDNDKPMVPKPHANEEDRAGIARSQLPHPDLPLSVPKRTDDFWISVELIPRVRVGIMPSGGMRNWISFSGDSRTAKSGSGTGLVSIPSPSEEDTFVF
ncbi:hypothetical protein F4824DRAFT_369287 [Ustulina deusta]|nr:hypothetical protein F4824DRAFT_369287 [Ustulina deusta]